MVRDEENKKNKKAEMFKWQEDGDDGNRRGRWVWLLVDAFRRGDAM